ncbi:SusC/RagA family TonB-linked outer membrane protein [Filimonas lacunae]|nr:SusC/RagA family TonB-linked outer membrane protein [Filimonas lacunae]
MKQKLTQTHYSGFLLLLLLALSAVTAFAQTTIKGKVTAANGSPLTGVNVSEKGTSHNAITSADGTYTIAVSKPGAVLSFTYVGYVMQEVKVGTQADISIALQEDNNDMREVVVTAFGIKREDKKIGYAVQSVKGSDLVKARESNPIAGLTGKVAGLSIGTNAEMLGRPNVVLRGNSDVLYVVDGVPVNSDTWNISPDDIETYTILKGPNAAALYGFRGQNGAIVLTTKKGSKDRKGWTIQFNSSQQVEKGFLALATPQKEYGRGTNYLYQYASGYTYGDPTSASFLGKDLLYDNGQRLAIWGPHFDGQLLKQYDSPYDLTTGVRTPTAYKARGTDNLKNFMEAGFLSTNNISASASGDNYDIRMSYSHTYQKGMAPNTKLNMDNLNINTSYKFSPRLSAEANLNYNTQYTPNIPDVSYGPNSYVYEFSVYGSADFDIRDLQNYWKGPQGITNLMQYNNEYGRANNPYFQASKWLHGHYKNDIYGYIKLNYKITDDLNASVRSQVTTWDQTRSESVPASINLNSYLATGWYTFGAYNGDYREDRRNLIENNSDLLLTYNKKLGNNWNLSALAGGSWRSFKYNSTYSTTQNLSVANVFSFQNTKSTPYIYSFRSNMMVYSGYYSVDLGYKNYFTVTTTGRVDNLSTLSKNNSTFFYPSVALSSSISDYVKLPEFISALKVRGSFASVKSGLTQATAPSAYMLIYGKAVGASVTTGGGLLGYGSELYSSYDGPSYANQFSYSTATLYNGQPSINYSTNIANPNLKPATNKSYEGGVDMKLFNNRIGANVTYFMSDNGPQIYQLAAANSTGFQTKSVNGVVTRKTGWEISMNAAPLQSKNGLNWNITVNWATFVEKLKAIYGTEEVLNINGHRYRVGERMDAYYGTGFMRDQQGNILYTKGAGTPLLNPSTSLDDKKFLGNLNPDYSFGINNSFSYKNFTFSFQFDGRVGGKIYDRVYNQMINAGTAAELAGNTAAGQARLKEWQSTNQGAVKPTGYYVGTGKVITSGTPVYSKGVLVNQKDVTLEDNTTATTVQSYFSSGISGGNSIDEYYMISRTFAKLREVTIGYTLPAKMLQSSFIKSASISLVGRNLLYFAARKDFDIDQYSSGYNFSSNSLSGTSSTDLQSPTARRYGININLTF